MGQSIPRQHPAVVLRSHYRHVKALLAVAMLAVAALAVVVVLLATGSDGSPGSASKHVGSSPAHVSSISAQAAARRSAVHGKGSPIIRTGVSPNGEPSERTVGLGH